MRAKSHARDGTVFVIDDDASMCDALVMLLSAAGWRVEAYRGAKEYLDQFDPNELGCIVLDMRMPGMSGLELQAELKRRGAKIPILMVTAYAEVPTVVRALKDGVAEFLQKPFREDDLLEKVERAIEGDVAVRRHEVEIAGIQEKLARLTEREREVMDLVVAGKATKVIAIDLGLSPKTVEVHRSRVMTKMEVTSIAALVNEVLRARRSLPAT